MKILGVIPARSQSKGIKDKNIQIIRGKELIYYTIKRAKESKMIDYLISSTDSQKYNNIFGLFIRDLATATLCLSPPEIESGYL